MWAGTLLGAYRHHGFIPWDDDMDVLITEPELEPLLACLASWPENIVEATAITWIARTGKDSDIIPLKVVSRKTGYYVDIFVCQLDGPRPRVCLSHACVCGEGGMGGQGSRYSAGLIGTAWLTDVQPEQPQARAGVPRTTTRDRRLSPSLICFQPIRARLAI